MKQAVSDIQGLKIRAGKATWTVLGDLGIQQAQEFHSDAITILGESSLKSLSINVPAEGVHLCTYQVLIALKQRVLDSGKSVDVVGNLGPVGGRIW